MTKAATLALALSLVSSHAYAFRFSLDFLSKRADSSRLKTDLGYVSPLDNGGKMLTIIEGTFPEGLGEPINMIISANSDAEVLVDSAQNGGLRNYWLSLQMSGECLGQHLGSHQGGNLGDGNGMKNETAVIRFNYGDPYLGTCQESIKGGNHFRYWVQNGKDANTGAIFMACSAEKSAAEFHDIIPDGYNLGRDWIVGNATAHPGIQTAQLTAGTEYIGSTVFGGYTYQTTVNYVAGLLGNTSDGVNHYQSVPVDGRAAMDGLVAVLNVIITDVPAGAVKPNHTTGGTDSALQQTWSAPLALLLLAAGVTSLW